MSWGRNFVWPLGIFEGGGMGAGVGGQTCMLTIFSLIMKTNTCKGILDSEQIFRKLFPIIWVLHILKICDAHLFPK